MKLETIQYQKNKGWSVKKFQQQLDSKNTLILVFASPAFIDNPQPIRELAEAYPQSKMIGCSSAGEILGPFISDETLSVAIMQFEKTPIEIIKFKINSSMDSQAIGEKIAGKLDNKDFYKEYLGEKAAGLPATRLLYPLAIRKDENDTNQLVRTILSIDENAQALIFAGDIPTGYLAQLMRANFDRLITGATEAGQLARSNLLDLAKGNIAGPVLSIAISCVGRRLLLGERTEEETESALEALPNETQQIGFYSYGELSPYATGDCELHNQTMTLTTICEV